MYFDFKVPIPEEKGKIFERVINRLTAELEELHNKQKVIRNEELLKAIENSARSYEEILGFIQGGTERVDD